MLLFSLLAPAFLSGFLMFFAPCTLPMVPGYLAFISGVTMKDKQEISTIKNKIRINSVFFVLGFSIVFILLGFLLGFFGSILGVYRNILLQVSGVVVILFGFMMLGIFSFSFLKREYKISLPSWLSLGEPKSSFLLGGIFALGWSPCIGPILGTLLILASTLSTAFQGAVLLFVFSLGLAVPFILTAFFFGSFENFFKRNTFLFKIFSILGGLVMIIIGVFLILDQWVVFQEIGFKIFNFIEYDRIQNYL